MNITSTRSNRCEKKTPLQYGGLYLLANIALIVGSYMTIPNAIVPITLQTLAVCLTGIMLGPLNGALAVFLWLIEALLGAPVLANGSVGAVALMGPSAGYLLSFPFVAMLVGYFRHRGSMGIALIAIIAQGVCLAVGSLWLSFRLQISFAEGLRLGCYPFIAGALVKAVILALLVKAWRVAKSLRLNS